MITPEQRLDQIEPLLAEHSTQLDMHTAQLRRIAHGIQFITEAISRQSDNITFLLQEQASMKAELNRHTEQLDRMEQTILAIYQAVQKPSGN